MAISYVGDDHTLHHQTHLRRRFENAHSETIFFALPWLLVWGWSPPTTPPDAPRADRVQRREGPATPFALFMRDFRLNKFDFFFRWSAQTSKLEMSSSPRSPRRVSKNVSPAKGQEEPEDF